ncbi:hypothetical protein [Phytohalomonas tamaricis]|uniref:hypothetical protein n=1 Tax=Phytohalomonas tamaricis TaxID=2081032 RepID=UPI000D0B40E0|nr:hypothetical protein [Phytohalomonas tamaricis]
MLAFARWVMRGLPQACGAALLASLIPWLFWVGAAVSALVTLRRGFSAAVPVLIAAAIPAGWWWMQGDTVPLAAVLMVTLMATVLRARVSWGQALIAAALATTVLIQLGIFLPKDTSQLLMQIRDSSPELDEMLANYAQQGVAVDRLTELVISAVTGLVVLFASIICLALARSWQAGLYNPGGFRSEFHQLRLSRGELAVVVAFGIIGVVLGLPSAALVAWVPLLVAGIALVHGFIGMKGMNGLWLVGFYVLLLTTWPTIVIVLLLALADTFANFRIRITSSQR